MTDERKIITRTQYETLLDWTGVPPSFEDYEDVPKHTDEEYEELLAFFETHQATEDFIETLQARIKELEPYEQYFRNHQAELRRNDWGEAKQ